MPIDAAVFVFQFVTVSESDGCKLFATSCIHMYMSLLASACVHLSVAVIPIETSECANIANVATLILLVH